MVLAESLLCETPVITLATPWADNSQGEVIGHGIGGLVATNPNSLFQGCKKLALDKKLRLDLGRAGASYVASKYDSVHVSRAVVRMSLGHELPVCSPAPADIRVKSEPYGFLTRLLLASPGLKKYAIYTTGVHPLFPALLTRFKKLLKSVKVFLGSTRSQ